MSGRGHTRAMPRIAVMGSGGLGGYFGALLARGGSDVTFVARGAHLAALRASGLRVEPDVVHLDRVQVTDAPGEVGWVDFVLVCVKLWDTQTALAAIRPMVGPDTAVISFQNGVLKEEALTAELRRGPGPWRRRLRCHDRVRAGCDHQDRAAGAIGVRGVGRLHLAASRSPAGRLPCGRYCRRAEPRTSRWRSGRSSCSWSACRPRRRRCGLPIGPIRSHPQDPRVLARPDARGRGRRTRARHAVAGGLRRAAVGVRRWRVTRDDVLDVSRPATRQPSRGTVAVRRGRRTRPLGRRRHTAQSRCRRHPGPPRSDAGANSESPRWPTQSSAADRDHEPHEPTSTQDAA